MMEWFCENDGGGGRENSLSRGVCENGLSVLVHPVGGWGDYQEGFFENILPEPSKGWIQNL